MAQQLVDMFPIQATADGVGIPLIGMAPQSYLTTVRVMSVFFTGALSLQVGPHGIVLSAHAQKHARAVTQRHARTMLLFVRVGP